MEATQQNPVVYRINLDRIVAHLLSIEAEFYVSGENSIDLFMPAWTPGSYLIREYARQIETIEALNSAIKLTKVGKDEWRAEWEQARDTIKLRYTIYARERSVRTNWIEPDFCFLTGAATFLSCETMLDRPHRFELSGLKLDSELVCSLRIEDAEDESCKILTARCFDELVDSPLLIGKLAIESFTVAGKPHRLISTFDSQFWDHAAAASDTAKIVETVQNFWGCVPYEAFDFQNLIVGGYGGLEHDNCTVLMADRWIMRDRKAYLEWLGLVCHEFFHTWNVRRLRPVALRQYDYRRESYFAELWIAEGTTSYFDDLLLLRAKLCSQAEYLERLSKAIGVVMDAPGRLVQSLADSSFDTWIKLYRPDENSQNSRISYYTKGAVVAWMLDVRLRTLSDNATSLDDVMRTLWQRYVDVGYTNADFEAIVADLVPHEWGSWFDRHVRSAEELDFTETLASLGLRFKQPKHPPVDSIFDFVRTIPSDSTEKEPSSSQTPSLPRLKKLSIDCETVELQGRTSISKIYRGGAAEAGGMQVGDEIVAANGLKVDFINWPQILKRFTVDEQVSFSVFRRDQLMQIDVTLRFKRPEWQLELDPAATAEAVENRNAWLE